MDLLKLIIIMMIALVLLKPDQIQLIARKIGFFWQQFNRFKQSIKTSSELTEQTDAAMVTETDPDKKP